MAILKVQNLGFYLFILLLFHPSRLAFKQECLLYFKEPICCFRYYSLKYSVSVSLSIQPSLPSFLK